MHFVMNQAYAQMLKFFLPPFHFIKYLPILLKLVLTLLLWGTLSAKGLAFDSFEHRFIGNQAFTKLDLDKDKEDPVKQDWMEALRLLGLEEKPDSGQSSGHPRQDYLAYARILPLRFGDLTALAGDHVEDPSKLLTILDLLEKAKKPEQEGDELNWEAKRFLALRRQWLNMCAWVTRMEPGISATIVDLNDCARAALEKEDKKLIELLEKGSVPNPLYGTDGYSPARAELAELERLPNFVGLAAENKSHFSTYSWKEYSDNHEKAIQFAIDYARFSYNDRLERLRLAIVHEGFAQHFLHDSFASGHLGTPFSRMKQKDLLLHTHDSLDRIGETVNIPLPQNFPWPGAAFIPRSAENKMIEGWMAFGDDHLFIPEAAFQRVVVIEMARQSLMEVLNASNGKVGRAECRMCTSFIFPRPAYLKQVESVANRDTKDLRLPTYQPHDLIPPKIPILRVPPLYLEGWKLFAGYGTYAGPLKDGGSVWDLADTSHFNSGSRPSASAVSIELGYLRTTGYFWAPIFRIPNYLGVGFVAVPGVRTSIYPISVGYWWPAEITEGSPIPWLPWLPPGLYTGVRLNAGLRVNDANSFLNSSDKDKISGESTVVWDLGTQYFSPFGIFSRLELATLNIQGESFPQDYRYSVDSIFGNGAFAWTVGVSYDLSAIR